MSAEAKPKGKGNGRGGYNPHFTTGGIERPKCVIEGCDNPRQHKRTRCSVCHRQYETERKRNRAKRVTQPMLPFTPLTGGDDLIVVVMSDDKVAGAVLYKPVRKLGRVEASLYGGSTRASRLDDGTLLFKAKLGKPKSEE